MKPSISSRILTTAAIMLAVSTAHSAVIWDESSNGDLSSISTNPTELGELPEGSYEIIASIDAGEANNGPDRHDYAVFTALAPWKLDLVSLTLTNTSSVLVGINDPVTGDAIAFDFLTNSASDLFGELPEGRYVLRFTPNGNVGQVSYAVQINVGVSEQPLMECEDGEDNDLDGLIDYPADPGCSSPMDDNETDGVMLQVALDNIEDGQLRNCIQAAAVANNWATTDEVDTLDCSGLVVRSSIGIEQFTELTHLDLHNNFIPDIDLSNNLKLIDLRLEKNSLTSIDVSANAALTLLYLANNDIPTIDVSNNLDLVSLWAADNLLTEVDVTSNPYLDLLDLRGNQLTAIDVASNTALRGLGLDDNQLTSIDISANTNLGSLNLDNNLLTTIDISTNTSLFSLRLRGNPLDPDIHAYLAIINGQNNLTIFLDPLDRDRDGIADVIDMNPDVEDPPTIVIGADYTLTILGSGRVASLQSSEFVYIEGRTVGAVTPISQRIYEVFQDDFDFIILADQWQNLSGRFSNSRTTASGLGIPVLDFGSNFGSAETLEGVVYLESIDALTFGPSLHEIGHNWMNYLASVPDSARHWGRSNVGGLLGGWAPNTLEDLGGGVYRAKNFDGMYGSWNVNGGLNSQPYSNLELYLMGLIEPDEVGQDIKIANDFAWVDQSAGTFQASSITTITMDDIVATDGLRQPGPASSKKDFRAIYVVLTDTPLTSYDWVKLDLDAYNFGLAGDDGTDYYNFWEATGGLATLKMGGLLGSLLPNVDSDGDGVINSADAFPYDPTEWDDTDSDGIGNNADADDDGDTMPDEYESANGLDPLNAADAAFDTDGDGYINLVEYRRRSNPNDANSIPKTLLPWLPLLLD